MAFTATSSAKRAQIEQACGVDMLSYLPQEVIHHIMQFLPLVDAARMSVLSKAWRNYWLSIPQLDFDLGFQDHFRDTDKKVDAYKWWSVINNILLLHKDSILEFSVLIPILFTSESCLPDITPWISYVSANGVKNFALLNQRLDFPSKLPFNFFSLVLLERLELQECTIGYNPCFTSLRNLSTLLLNFVVFEHGVATKFFSSCPSLETLHIFNCSFGVDELIINMPSLNKLRIKDGGAFPSPIHFKNASSLRSFSLDLDCYGISILKVKGKVDMIKFLSNSCALQKLHLNGPTCWLLASSDILRILPTTFMQLKVLEFSLLNVHVKHVFSFVLGMLQSCLNMVELNIGVLAHIMNPVTMLENSEDQEWLLTHLDNDYTFNHLHTIYIDFMRGHPAELKLISYLLACSPSLKRLSFSCHPFLTDSAKQEVHRKLFKLWKASPKAKIVYHQWGGSGSKKIGPDVPGSY